MEIKQTNFAIIGLGGRGQGNLGELISIDGVKVVAVCDKYEDRARRGVEIVKEKTGEEPRCISTIKNCSSATISRLLWSRLLG